MLLLKAVTVIFAGVVTLFVLHRVMGRLQAEKVRAKPEPRRAVRLRQDPHTGIYYPEG